MPKYPDDLTASATEHGQALFAIELTGETCKPNELGKLTLMGTIDQEDGLRLMLFFRLIRKDRTVREAFAEAFPVESPAKTSIDRLFTERKEVLG